VQEEKPRRAAGSRAGRELPAAAGRGGDDGRAGRAGDRQRIVA